MKKYICIVFLILGIFILGVATYADEEYMTESGEMRDVEGGEIMTDSGEVEEVGSDGDYMTDSGEERDVEDYSDDDSDSGYDEGAEGPGY